MNRTRILYVIDSMGRGGAETQLFKTLARLSIDKFEAFIVLSREPGDSYEQLAALPIVQEIIVLHDTSRFNSQAHRVRFPILSLVQKAFRLAGIIKSVKPAIIHSWLWYSNLLCGIVRQFSLTPSRGKTILSFNRFTARRLLREIWSLKVVVDRKNYLPPRRCSPDEF